MKSIISALYNGQILPYEQDFPKTEECRRIHAEHYRHYCDFAEQLAALTPPLDRRFLQIMDEQLDALPLDFSETFADGFRLGARIMIDVFQSDVCVD